MHGYPRRPVSGGTSLGSDTMPSEEYAAAPCEDYEPEPDDPYSPCTICGWSPEEHER